MPITLTWGSSLEAQHCQLALLFSALFPQLWGISVPLSSPQPGNDECFFLCLLIPAGREGYHSLPTWETLASEICNPEHWAQNCKFPGNHSGDCGVRTRPVSEQGSVSDWGHPELLHSSLDVDNNYHFCGPRDFPGNLSWCVSLRYSETLLFLFCPNPG